MFTGLYSGVSGLALGVGLYKGVSGLWSGATGFDAGFAGSSPFSGASLALDFLSGAPLDSRITFTRGSTATFVGSNGLIQSAAINTPRFDYDPVTLAPKGLLIEGARTNRLTYSADFSNAAWIAVSAKNVVASANPSPDGTLNAWVITDNSTIAYEGINQNVTIADDTASYTFSMYVRKTSGGTAPTFGVNLRLANGTTVVQANIRVNTDTGASYFGGSVVEDCGAFWRVSRNITNNATGNTQFQMSIFPAAAESGSGVDVVTATGSATIFGAQMELSTFATSYIPTGATTVTREADVAVMTGTNFSPWYNATEGTLVANFATTQISSSITTIAAISDGTVNNEMLVYYGTTNSISRVAVGGAVQASISSAALLANNAYRFAFAYKVNDFASSLAGGAVGTDTTGTIPTVNLLTIGHRAGNINHLNGYIRQIAYYNTRLSNTQLQALTA